MQYVNIHTHRPTGRHIEPTSAGIHPWNTGMAILDADELAAITASAQIIGETGLDLLKGDFARQKQFLYMHLQLAADNGKPVILHCVRTFEPMLAIAGRYNLSAVIFHGFIGSSFQAEIACKRGYYLSFGERSLRSPRATEALRTMPLQNLFLETDDSETSIEEIYARAAEVRGTTVEELQAAILDNYNRLFAKQ